MLNNAGVFTVVALNILTGLGWISLGILVSMIVQGPWWTRVSIISLGFFAGLFRIEYVDWFWERTNESSFLKTNEAFILSVFTLLSMIVIGFFLVNRVRENRRRRRFDRDRNR